MPELPEVESVRRSLLPTVRGRMISHVEVLNAGVWLNAGLKDSGWRIDDLRRRGKYLIFELSQKLAGETARQQARLIVHLRMTGQLLLQNECQPLAKHAHIRLQLDPAKCSEPGDNHPLWLVYHDTRRFGRLWLLPANGQSQPEGLAKLGPEPLDPEFNSIILTRQLSRRQNSKLKAVLLDQSVIAGLGNIYADEILFASGINPARTVSSLSSAEQEKLTWAIITVLNDAIACQGTTLRDYVNGWNQRGTYQNCLSVYGRTGQPCRVCGHPIESRRLSGRTTCWCPVCQQENFPAKEIQL